MVILAIKKVMHLLCTCSCYLKVDTKKDNITIPVQLYKEVETWLKLMNYKE